MVSPAPRAHLIVTSALRAWVLLVGLIVAVGLALLPAGTGWAASAERGGAASEVRQTDSSAGYPNDPGYSTVPADPGITPSMDVNLTSSEVTDIPSSVQPGQTFTIGIDAAPGAHCAGTIAFRGPPPIELPDIVANGEICSWSVTTPTIARQGTAIVDAQVTKNGQSWRVASVVYVNPPGESR